MSTESSKEYPSIGPFSVIGRDPRIDLSKYTVMVMGREIIDYEKLSREDPELYADIVALEREADRDFESSDKARMKR